LFEVIIVFVHDDKIKNDGEVVNRF